MSRSVPPMFSGERGPPAGGLGAPLEGRAGWVGLLALSPLPHWARICAARAFICLSMPMGAMRVQSNGCCSVPAREAGGVEAADGGIEVGREALALLPRTSNAMSEAAMTNQMRALLMLCLWMKMLLRVFTAPSLMRGN